MLLYRVEAAAQLLAHIGEQSKHITAQDNRIDSQAQAIKWRDAKIESITFQLARLKAWMFGAKTQAHERRAALDLRGDTGR
jgi:transposase